MAQQRSTHYPATGNVGRIDAAVRWVAGTVAVLSALLAPQSAALSFLELLVALLLIGTALTHTCPAYWLLGVRTKTPGEHERPQH